MSAQESPSHFIDIEEVRTIAASLGFASSGFAELSAAGLAPLTAGFEAWLAAGFHGEMGYMKDRLAQRMQPELLLPEVRSVLMVSLDYRPQDPLWQAQAWASLGEAEQAYVSCYALGRDYHKIIRARLQKLAEKLCERYGDFSYRAFCDSAPVMELPLAERAGLGWRGKHTLLLNRDHGSMFFIGSLFTSLALPSAASLEASRVASFAPAAQSVAAEAGVEMHCGSCTKCIEVCPTQAIVAPHRLDARRCISYLTIEHRGAIPLEFREAIGNRIYGCDDCQLVCPWNKFAQAPIHVDVRSDLAARNTLDRASLLQLWSWSETEFLSNTEGSAIRRIGYWRWRRNLVVAMGSALRGNALRGNALRPLVKKPSTKASAGENQAENERSGVAATRGIKTALQASLNSIEASLDPIMQEHLHWALQQGA
jgi:epoxyqueuosine reductase